MTTKPKWQDLANWHRNRADFNAGYAEQEFHTAAALLIESMGKDVDRVDWMQKYGYGLRSRKNGQTNVVCWNKDDARKDIDFAMQQTLKSEQA